MSHYTESFVHMRRSVLTILKDLGFGRLVVERRINVELDLLERAVMRQQQQRDDDGRGFDPTELLFRCVNGVIMGFMFGRHFDYETDPLTKHLRVFIDAATSAFTPTMNLFPVLRFLPGYRDRVRRLVVAHRLVVYNYFRLCSIQHCFV